MAENYFLIVDAGTGGGRCLIFDDVGTLHAIAYQEWTYYTPEEVAPYGREFNPNEFWEIICNISKQAIKQAKIKPKQIKGVSASSFREGAVFINENGKELYAGPANDIRALEQGMNIKASHGKEIYHITGRTPPFMFASARLKWFKEKKAEIYNQIDRILMMNEWILFKFSGQAYSEPTNVCETDLFNIHSRTWSKEILKWLDLKDDIFPNVVNAGTKIGEVTNQAAAETSLIEGTPVVMGGADSQCALLGMGFREEGQLGIVAGTTTALQVITSRPILDEKMRTWTNNYLFPNFWILESNAGESGKIFRWIRDNMADLEREVAQEEGKDAFQLMDNLVTDVPPGSEGVFAFLGPMIMNMDAVGPLGFGGFLFELPIYMGNYGKKQMIRAFLESMAYAIKGNWDQLESISKMKIKEAGICGGLAKSELFVQMIANTLRFPIKTYQTIEATGLGTAICAAVGTGVHSSFSEAINAMVQLQKIVEPDPAQKKYRKFYKKWLKLSKKLRQI
ncbi:MAG: hypothetical protein HWN66_09900 [Candidatus Helarchaeota archaeon]|nr:hypothetical protein [Candidatus Helarchaeota archaeon]